MSNPQKESLRGMIFAMIVIFILFIPVVVGYYVESEKFRIATTTPESNYVSALHMNSMELNYTQALIYTSGYTIYGNESNNDTVILNPASKCHITNDVTTVNNTNTVNLNSSHLVTGSSMIHQLDVTTHDLTDYDLIKLVTNAEHQFYHLVWFNGVSFTSSFIGQKGSPQANNTWIYIIDIAKMNSLKSAPNSEVYLSYSVVDTTDNVYTFEMTAYELSNTVWAWDDYSIFAMTLITGIAILSVTIAFCTDTLDIIIDRNRKNQK